MFRNATARLKRLRLGRGFPLCDSRCVLLCGIITLAVVSTSRAASLDEQFLAGLRERQLFSLAEKYCLEELSADDLAADRRTELSLELARTYAQHALFAPPAERATYWQRAHATAASFLERVSKAGPHSRARLLMRLQDALTHLARGELSRQEVQVDLADSSRLEPAKKELRTAITGLEQASASITAALREAIPNRRAEPDRFSLQELQALQRNVAYQLARGLRNQGLCYPTESADRANSLTQAVERLKPLAELSVADATIWRGRVDLIVCLRLLQQFDAATRALSQLIAAKPAPEYLLRAMAEKIRLDLAQDKLSAAQASMQQGRTALGQQSAELDFAHLETVIAAWRAAAEAENEVRAAALEQQATAQVQLLEREYGAYWMRRAETLLARLVSGTEGGDVATLRRAAESFYRGGRLDEALRTYDRAAATAEQAGDRNNAFALGFTAASIEHQRPALQAALDRYRKLSLKMPRQERASEAHLLAIVNAVERVRATSDTTERQARMRTYEELLQEHLKYWPEGDSADQVRLWLGKLLEARRDWSGAMVAYRGVRPEYDQYEVAIRGAIRTAEANLQATAAAGKLDPRLAQEAALFCEQQIVGSTRTWPEKWSPAQLACAVAAAKFRLQYATGGAEPAERVLAAALSLAPEAPADWQAEARLLLVSALATQGKQAAAAAELKQISTGSIPGILTALADLDKLAAAAAPAQRTGLADLELRLSDLLNERKNDLNKTELRTLETIRAAALARAGHPLEALKAYESLTKRYPRDGELHEAHAALLATASDATSRRLALKKWRTVESKTRRGEARWFRARLAQAELLYRLQDKRGAAKLIQLTAILQPELGGSELKPKFEALLKASEK